MGCRMEAESPVRVPIAIGSGGHVPDLQRTAGANAANCTTDYSPKKLRLEQAEQVAKGFF